MRISSAALFGWSHFQISTPSHLLFSQQISFPTLLSADYYSYDRSRDCDQFVRNEPSPHVIQIWSARNKSRWLDAGNAETVIEFLCIYLITFYWPTQSSCCLLHECSPPGAILVQRIQLMAIYCIIQSPISLRPLAACSLCSEVWNERVQLRERERLITHIWPKRPI
jgi:hypothetical protein